MGEKLSDGFRNVSSKVRPISLALSHVSFDVMLRLVHVAVAIQLRDPHLVEKLNEGAQRVAVGAQTFWSKASSATQEFVGNLQGHPQRQAPPNRPPARPGYGVEDIRAMSAAMDDLSVSREPTRNVERKEDQAPASFRKHTGDTSSAAAVAAPKAQKVDGSAFDDHWGDDDWDSWTPSEPSADAPAAAPAPASAPVVSSRSPKPQGPPSGGSGSRLVVSPPPAAEASQGEGGAGNNDQGNAEGWEDEGWGENWEDVDVSGGPA